MSPVSKQRYYRVTPAYWTDHPEWDDDTLLLGVYLLTCRHRSTEGLFHMPSGYARDDRRWAQKKFDRAWATLLDAKFIEYDAAAGVVLITNALKYQAPDNENQVKAALKALELLPRTALLSLFLERAELFCQRLAKGLRERFPEQLALPIADPPSPAPSPTPEQQPGASAPAGTAEAVHPDFGAVMDIAAKAAEQDSTLLVHDSATLSALNAHRDGDAVAAAHLAAADLTSGRRTTRHFHVVLADRLADQTKPTRGTRQATGGEYIEDLKRMHAAATAAEQEGAA